MILLYILGGSLAVLILYFLFLGICALLVSPYKDYEQNSPFYRFLLDSATAVAMKLLRIRVNISGIEKIPKDEKVLFVCNHRSNFDPILTWYAFKEWKIAFVSKPENFKIPFFGRIIRKCCFLPIDRENPRKAIVTINKAAKLLKKQEVSIGIYPEGTRSKTESYCHCIMVYSRLHKRQRHPLWYSASPARRRYRPGLHSSLPMCIWMYWSFFLART